MVVTPPPQQQLLLLLLLLSLLLLLLVLVEIVLLMVLLVSELVLAALQVRLRLGLLLRHCSHRVLIVLVLVFHHRHHHRRRRRRRHHLHLPPSPPPPPPLSSVCLLHALLSSYSCFLATHSYMTYANNSVACDGQAPHSGSTCSVVNVESECPQQNDQHYPTRAALPAAAQAIIASAGPRSKQWLR